jgi:hypothetical protein
MVARSWPIEQLKQIWPALARFCWFLLGSPSGGIAVGDAATPHHAVNQHKAVPDAGLAAAGEAPLGLDRNGMAKYPNGRSRAATSFAIAYRFRAVRSSGCARVQLRPTMDTSLQQNAVRATDGIEHCRRADGRGRPWWKVFVRIGREG